VTPISLGIFASANFSVAGSYESIATVTSTGSSGDLVFSSIPGTYTHLQIRGILRTNDTGSFNNQRMRFNSDSTSSYAFHLLTGDGTTITSSSTTTAGSINDFMRAPGTGVSSGIFSVAVIDILDYANTNKYKTVRILQGGDQNAGGNLGLNSALWMKTDAITNITISPSGGTAESGSTFALYGIKGPA
jgi:hypothetical protein